MLVNRSTCKSTGYFKKAGRLVSYALMIGACNLSVFNRCIVEYLTTRKRIDEIAVGFDDISDAELKEKIVNT